MTGSMSGEVSTAEITLVVAAPAWVDDAGCEVHPQEKRSPASTAARSTYHTGLIQNHFDQLEISHPIVVLVHSCTMYWQESRVCCPGVEKDLTGNKDRWEITVN